MKRITTALASMLLVCGVCIACTQADASQSIPKETTFKVSPNDITNQAALDRMQHERQKMQAAMRTEQLALVTEALEAEAEPEEEWVDEYYEWYEPDYVEYYEPVYYESSYTGGSTATTLGDLLNGQGRAYGEDGTAYTWYYHDLGYGELDIPGEHFDEDGVSYDEDNYIVVATDAYEKGTVLDTPYGEAKVYDSGCGSTIDVYTNR